MTGRTHKLSGKVVASFVFIALNFDPLLKILQEGLTEDTFKVMKVFDFKNTWQSILSALAALLILRTFAKVTSVLNDLDQQPQSIPYKDSLAARLVNKILQALHQHHRSHATHTLTLAVVWCAGLTIGGLYVFEWNSPVMLVVLGYVCGYASHVLADMFNGTGVYILPFWKKKVAFVPNKVNSVKLLIFSLIIITLGVVALVNPIQVSQGVGIVLILIACALLGVAVCCRGMTFTTGGQWENIFYKVVNVLDVAATTLACLICFI